MEFKAVTEIEKAQLLQIAKDHSNEAAEVMRRLLFGYDLLQSKLKEKGG